MIKWDHWHIETSSICPLKCPRCPRSEIPESLLNTQLTLDFFKKQIGESVIKQIKKITFCGNDGDPIYCKDFLPICSWIKKVNNSIELVIITNGSYKTKTWWGNLAEILTVNDSVHFSLDGYDQLSNNLYRVGSNFQDALDAIQILQKLSPCYLVWDAIAFQFNENHLNKMQDLAKSLNMDCFQLTKSTKFGSKYPTAYGQVDNLEPKNSSLVSSSYRFERQLTSLSQRKKPGEELRQEFSRRAKQLTQYSGICLIGNKGVFLNSKGEFYPCCWTANRYPHNKNWHSKFNLFEKTFVEIITDKFWTTDFLNFDSLECKTKCTPDRLSDESHIVDW